jgi:hypothetical protein
VNAAIKGNGLDDIIRVPSKDFKDFYTVDSWEYAQSWVIKYDPTTLKEVARAPGGEGGHHLALSPDDKCL